MIKFNLKKMMKEKKITLKELSSKTGLSINTLSLLSTGKSKGVQFDTLERIIDVLECKIEDLIILDDGYNTLEILDVELIPKDNLILLISNDKNMYLKCTYLNEDREEKKLLLMFNENEKIQGITVTLAGDFPTEILTSEKHINHVVKNRTLTSKLDLFVPFMALIFKKAYENEIFDFSSFPLVVNFMPYAEQVISSSMWDSRNFYTDKIKNDGELKEYYEIEGFKLLISYKMYDYELTESKDGD